MKKYLEIGKAVGQYGVKGQVKLQPWCDTPQFVLKFKTLYSENGKRKYEILSSFVKKNNVVLTIKDVTTVQEALDLKNKIFYVDRNDVDLDKDVYFVQDLLNLKVVDAKTNELYGLIIDIFKTGANDVYKIKSDNGKEYLFPAVSSMIEDINIKEGIVKVKPIKGIFDNED